MTQSMENLVAAAHDVDGVSPDISSVADELARGQLTLVNGLVNGRGDDEQRHTDFTLKPLTRKDIIDAELAAERVVQTANGSELVRSPAMVEFELLRRQAQVFGQGLVGMGRQGGASLHGLGLRANTLGSWLDRLGHQGQRTFSVLRLGLVSVSSGFDYLETRAKAAYGSVVRLYGLLAGGASLYGLKKVFIDLAAAMENHTIRLNSLNHHNKAQPDIDLKWAIQNAKDTTWGLQGVVQEYTSSRGFGMSREEARHFITILEDQGARHGWKLPEAQVASLQLKQMYSRKSIQAQDASLLTGYSIDVYSVLTEKLGKSRNEMTTQGEKGLLEPKSIEFSVPDSARAG